MCYNEHNPQCGGVFWQQQTTRSAMLARPATTKKVALVTIERQAKAFVVRFSLPDSDQTECLLEGPNGNPSRFRNFGHAYKAAHRFFEKKGIEVNFNPGR